MAATIGLVSCRIPSSPHVCLSVLIKAKCDYCLHFLLLLSISQLITWSPGVEVLIGCYLRSILISPFCLASAIVLLDTVQDAGNLIYCLNTILNLYDTCYFMLH